MRTYPSRLLKKTHIPPACLKQAFRIVALDRCRNHSRSKRSRSNVPPKYVSARRFFARRSAVFDPDPSTMLRVMVRYSNHEAQTRRGLGRSLAAEIFLTSLQIAFFNNLLGDWPVHGVAPLWGPEYGPRIVRSTFRYLGLRISTVPGPP